MLRPTGSQQAQHGLGARSNAAISNCASGRNSISQERSLAVRAFDELRSSGFIVPTFAHCRSRGLGRDSPMPVGPL